MVAPNVIVKAHTTVKGVDRWRDRVFAAARASLATAAEQTVSTSVVGECDDKMIIYSLRE